MWREQTAWNNDNRNNRAYTDITCVTGFQVIILIADITA